MPGRKTPLITNEIYHVYNRGIDRRPTFTSKREYQRGVETLIFYRHTRLPLRLSQYLQLSLDDRENALNRLQNSSVLVRVISYCLMPNHFHLLLKQVEDKGISKFLSNFQNSYTRYFNTRHRRDGSLFLDQFKAVRIETDEQLLHVSRYIHLNPYASYVVKSLEELEMYEYSSLSDYLEAGEGWVNKEIVLNFYRERSRYKEFVFNQADYQRKLKKIEHLMIEKY